MPKPSPELLELLRSQSGLSIDEEGRFLHRGEPITHERTLEQLWSSLERRPDGRYLVSIGRESGYVALADAPYAVRNATLTAGGAELLLSDGSREALRPETVWVDSAGVLHCQVKGAHAARFTRAGQVALAGALIEDPGAASGFALSLAGRRFPIARR